MGALPASVLRWLAILALTTSALWLLRPQLDKAHMALAYLLVVLGGSARHGRRLGLGLAVLGFLCFNFYLLPPYHTFIVADPVDWLVLLSFLVTSGVAAQLLYRAQHETLVARQRAEEMERLSTLGAETLSAGRTEEVVEAIARVVQSTLRISLCEIHQWDRDTLSFRQLGCAVVHRPVARGSSESLFASVVERGAVALVRTDGSTALMSDSTLLEEALSGLTDARVILVPLQVRGRAVGVLQLADREPIRLDSAQARFTAVLSYYAALGVERVGLVAEEERAATLREADRLKDALLASVSHDLRTPLTTIKAMAQELAATGDDRVVTIEREADRLNRLVADLLDLSRLNAGAVPMNLEIIAAEDLVGVALQRISGMQGSREIRVSLPATDSMLVGRFDFSYALRSLVNLLENALKYAPAAASVEVCVRGEADQLVFDVLDRGPGVSAEEAVRIFDPFYRAAGRDPDTEGTGLGLAIARRLAEAQGGSVEHRARTGGGSVFTLSLPIAEVPALSEVLS